MRCEFIYDLRTSSWFFTDIKTIVASTFSVFFYSLSYFFFLFSIESRVLYGKDLTEDMEQCDNIEKNMDCVLT